MRANQLLCFTAITLFTACAVGPDYKRPTAGTAPSFKEAGDWQKATPMDTAIRGKWWEVFHDKDLDSLEEQVAISNQNVKAAEAAYRQARALVAEARAGFFPTVSATGSLTRSGSSGSRGVTILPGGVMTGGTTTTGTTTTTTAPVTTTSGTRSGTGSITNTVSVGLDASWEPDLWGRIRRTVEANEATAEATNADLAAAQLSAQSELAIDYLDLRVADEQKRYLWSTVVAYKRAAKLTQNTYKAGTASKLDVLQANVQLETAQAQLMNVGVERAQDEHAIAMLIGKAPAELTIAEVNAVPTVPAIPVGVPSELLQRRPDIAGAERREAAANAQIGIAEAAYYPNLTLSASGGFENSSLSHLFSLPDRIWSIGPQLAETLFDAGLRHAQTEAAVANYDATVATYRQTVLGSFQEVEDNLAALRIYGQEADIQKQAVKDAHAATQIALNQYKAGIQNYLNVVTQQTAELNTELTALTVEKEQLTAAATLIKALGGGWKTDHKMVSPETSASASKPTVETMALPAAAPVSPIAPYPAIVAQQSAPMVPTDNRAVRK